MKPRIWIISEFYDPEETSTRYHMTKISEGLAGEFSVHAICSQPTYFHRGHLSPADEDHHGVRIHRYWSTTFADMIRDLSDEA